MKKFNPFIILTMLGIFLFLGGCQKDDVFTNLKLENTFILKGYNPVFDTIPKDVLGGRNTIDSVPFQAPTTAELVQLSEDLKTISSSHSIAQKAISLKKAGNVLNYDYSMIYHNVNSPNGYLITMPFIKDDKVTAILIYTRFDDNDFFINIYSSSDIETIISAEFYSSDEIYTHFNVINLFVNFQFIIEKSVDAKKADWLKVNSRIVSRNPAGRCVIISYLVPIIEHVAFVPSQPNFSPHYTWGWTTVYQILCDQDHNGYIGEGTTLTGSNGSAGSNGLQSIEIELVNKFHGLDADCLRLLQSDIKDELLNAVSPCDPENFANKIMQAFNNACSKAKQEGGNNFLQNIEIWEFSESIKNALDGVDYIIDNINYNKCPQVKCILDKLLKYNFGPNDSPGFSYLDCSKNGFKFETGVISQGGVANWTTKTITINEKYCNNNADPISIAETILHESMHLALWATQTQLTNGDPNINIQLMNAVNTLNIDFGGNHHEYLAAYLEGIANTLWNLNGQTGTPEDYFGLIWNGLSHGAGVDPNTNQAFSLYITKIMNHPGNNPNNLNYTDWIHSQLNRYLNIIKPNNILKFDCP
jgi:hypothetical protein